VQSRVVDCLVEGKLSNQTCCAVSSSLLAHAPRVIAGCEAARTMYPGVSQENAVRQSRICQHRGGLGARLDGKVNSGEPVINLVKHNRLKVLTSLNQKVCGRLFLFHIGTHGQQSRRGIIGTYAIVSTTRNTVSPYRGRVSGKAICKES
jgi:hypothetical protein